MADRAAITFHITVTLAGGSTMHIRGVEIFTVTDDGLISAVEAYWGDEDLTFDQMTAAERSLRRRAPRHRSGRPRRGGLTWAGRT